MFRKKIVGDPQDKEYIRQLKMRIDGLEADNERMGKLMSDSITTTQSTIDQLRRWVDFHYEIVKWANTLPEPTKHQFGEIWDRTVMNFRFDKGATNGTTTDRKS